MSNSLQPPVPPPIQPVSAAVLNYRSPLAQGASAVWRDGYLLVCTKDARFPERCIKCNAPATRFLRRKLTWHNPLIYLVILANLIIYAIVAMAVQKRGTIHVALCERHMQRRTTLMLIATAMFVMSIFSLIAAIVMENAALGILFPLLLLASAIVAIIVSRVVTVDHIDERLIFLKNVNKDFLLELPAQAPTHTAIDQIVVQHLQQR